MKKLALSAGASLIILGSISPADAQFGYRHGYYGGGWGPHYYGRYHRGWGGGGAVAAGLIGGLVLGGIAAAAAAPRRTATTDTLPIRTATGTRRLTTAAITPARCTVRAISMDRGRTIPMRRPMRSVADTALSTATAAASLWPPHTGRAARGAWGR
jgi:hypothetical protein